MADPTAIDVFEHRPDPQTRTWDLPAWGHPLSRIVLPLFIRDGDLLVPAGTAFWVGRHVAFVLTATHTVVDALRRDGRFDRALASGPLPAQAALKNVGLYVLHPNGLGPDAGRFSLVPLETLNGGYPLDAIFGYPVFEAGRVTGSLKLSFDPPRIGERVLSVGYRDVEPRKGLPFDAVRAGTFDWLNDYSHRFTVVEGVVERIFVERFARGFLEGPCFLFDNHVDHGLSGGPVITADSRIVGINSAGAELYLDRPAALASMLYPLLLTKLQFGAQIGPVRLNAAYPLYDLVGQGRIWTDGSEAHVGFKVHGDGQVGVSPRVPKADHPWLHDDFSAFQAGKTSQPISGAFHRLVRRDPEA